MKQEDRDALREWAEYKKSIEQSTSLDADLTPEEIEKHRMHLEKHPVEWIQYFFPKYCKYPFAPFHKDAIRRLTSHDEWYEVLSWSRELAKSTVAMFVLSYLACTGRKRNIILASATTDAAERLLAPFKINFEVNARLKAYYGEFENPGDWTSSELTTKQGFSFTAIGAGSAPRGSRKEDVRPDVLYLDDFDTDEACRNIDVLNKRWEWWEKALYPTRSISEPTLVLWCGNIIADDCCITRAGETALQRQQKNLGNWDIVNIRDKNGHSTWPEKNTEEFIDITLSGISKKAQMGEYFNTPMQGGTVFTKLAFGKVPPLSKFKFVIAYGDPAPGESKKKGASFKAVWLVGKLHEKLYVIKGFLDHATNEEFIEWFFKLQEYVAGKTTLYCMIENNKLQDPFFQQVLKPHLRRLRKKLGVDLQIKPDEDKKTDKATRIEADLEPLDREGSLIFNEEEKDNPHMKELIHQFDVFELTLPYPADGPDCIQGGYRAISRKNTSLQKTVTVSRASLRAGNKYRR